MCRSDLKQMEPKGSTHLSGIPLVRLSACPRTSPALECPLWISEAMVAAQALLTSKVCSAYCELPAPVHVRLIAADAAVLASFVYIRRSKGCGEREGKSYSGFRASVMFAEEPFIFISLTSRGLADAPKRPCSGDGPKIRAG